MKDVSIKFVSNMLEANPVLMHTPEDPLSHQAVSASMSGFVPVVHQEKDTSSVSLVFIEETLTRVCDNQELILQELKKKNKYEAWKTFFSGVKLVTYIAVLYVSYVGMLDLWEKIESGAFQQSLFSNMNIESVLEGALSHQSESVVNLKSLLESSENGALVFPDNDTDSETPSAVTVARPRPVSVVQSLVKSMESKGLNPVEMISNLAAE